METVNSVLSTRSNSSADSNSTSKDENSSQSEEEWEAVESDSEIEIDDQSKQAKTKTQNLSNSHPDSPQRGFGSVTDWSGFNSTDEVKADITSNTKHSSSGRIISTSEEIINKSSGRNSSGFQTPQPEPSVAEPNRYSKSSNSTFRQAKPMNRGPSFPQKSGIENHQRFTEQSNGREIDGHIRSNPNDRPARNYNLNSSSARHGVFGSSQSSVSNDRNKAGGATMANPNEPKVPQQRYGIFSSTKSSSSADERHLRDIISRDRVSKSNSPTSNYGIFSTPKTTSDNQMKLRDSTRENTTRVDPGFNSSTKESSPSPRLGIFTSSKKASPGDGCVVDKS